MRRFLCILANLALVVAFLEAPYLHVHQHEATQRHPGAFLHFHLKTTHALDNSADLRGLDPDDDALSQNWVSVHPVVSGYSPVIRADYLFTPDSPQKGSTIDAALTTGPDPPHISRKIPRAPPA